MVSVSSITTLIQVFILLVNATLSIVYIVPILIHPRFHLPPHTVTANIAFAILCCTVSWLIGFILRELRPDIYSIQVSCALMFYFQAMCTLQVPLAAIQGSFHRFLSIVYYRKYSAQRNLNFLLCHAVQWLIGIVLTIPHGFPRKVRSSGINESPSFPS